MAYGIKPPPHLPVGSVIEQRRGDQIRLVVQESSGKTSIIESWDDSMDVSNRLFGRIRTTLEQMNSNLAAFDQKLAADMRKTSAKIDANQRLLDELVKGRA
jgi:hypothetical protein